MNKSLQDIRAEVVSSDIRTKSIAIEKATYLHSLGFNMNWASFHVVELMSTANVKYKESGIWPPANLSGTIPMSCC